MKINKKRLAIGMGLSFVFIFLFEWLFHGNLMMGMYNETAHLWRPEEEMGFYFKWMLLMQILTVIFLGLIFIKGYENKGISEGIRFGLYVGGLLGIAGLTSYGYMPIPLLMAVLWALASVIIGVGVGVILSLCKIHTP